MNLTPGWAICAAGVSLAGLVGGCTMEGAIRCTGGTCQGQPSPDSGPGGTQPPGLDAGTDGGTLRDGGTTADGGAVRQVGINPEPSMRPWRYLGPNPDGWWDPTQGLTYLNAEMALAAQLGVQTVRVEFPWWVLEPSQGAYDWTRADAIVAAANAHNIQLTPIIVYTPSWAGAAPNSIPNASDFSSFVTALVTRYHASIHAWEMWNEPDLSKYFNGSESQYVSNVLLPGSQAVRAADPTAKVVMGGPSGPGTSWFNTLYTLGAKGAFDVAAFHDYALSASQVNSDARSVRAALDANGDTSVPLWLGEFGYQETGVQDPNQQALIQGVLTAAGPLAMAQWYNIRDDYAMTCCPPQIVVSQYFGLVEHDDVTPKQGFTTFQTIVTQGQLGAVTP